MLHPAHTSGALIARRHAPVISYFVSNNLKTAKLLDLFITLFNFVKRFCIYI